jgi:hypothetical protein
MPTGSRSATGWPVSRAMRRRVRCGAACDAALPFVPMRSSSTAKGVVYRPRDAVAAPRRVGAWRDGCIVRLPVRCLAGAAAEKNTRSIRCVLFDPGFPMQRIAESACSLTEHCGLARIREATLTPAGRSRSRMGRMDAAGQRPTKYGSPPPGARRPAGACIFFNVEGVDAPGLRSAGARPRRYRDRDVCGARHGRAPDSAGCSRAGWRD